MQPFGLSMQDIQQRPDYYCRCNQKVVNALQELGELDNTCIFYTSDQGYHLGHFRLVMGKSIPFIFDIKVTRTQVLSSKRPWDQAMHPVIVWCHLWTCFFSINSVARIFITDMASFKLVWYSKLVQ